jgi:methylene-fatty-acyl-phospholipid synthase
VAGIPAALCDEPETLTTLWTLLVAASVLSIERICYAWVWYHPVAFRRWCANRIIALFGEPVDVLRNLFLCFKTIQLGVFFGWCYIHGDGNLIPPGEEGWWMAAGGTLIVAGQMLNLGVFVQLGKIGVFYGNKLGYHVPRCEGFPFSLFRHPQYIGTVLSIWGFFMTTRFPHDDWYLLPILQTGYYVVGAYLEQ